jgi:uncharacterized membrane protein
MATRKKKTEGSVKEVKVEKGSHLTVTTYPDGRTELEWDDEALARDVREALASVEKPKPKKTRTSGKSKVDKV